MNFGCKFCLAFENITCSYSFDTVAIQLLMEYLDISVLSTVALLESSAREGGGEEDTPIDVGTVMLKENMKNKEESKFYQLSKIE